MTSFYTSVLQHRGKLLVSGYRDGQRYYSKVSYKPYLFTSSDDPDAKYKTIHGHPVKRIDFPSIHEAREFIKTYQEVENFKLYGSTRFPYTYIFDTFKNIKYDTSLLKQCVLDIETDSEGGYPDIEKADKHITAITCQYINGKTFVFGLVDFVNNDPDIYYFKCKDEREILIKLIKLWANGNYRPDVVTGWNIEFFDIPYIVKRIILVLGEEEAKKLSPFGVIEEKTVFNNGKEQTVYVPLGINILDYLHLYQKFTYNQQESYKLDHIAYLELGENKIDWGKDYESLDDLYKRNPQLYIEYNIQDCRLIQRLDAKMKLLDLVYTFAYDAGINYADTLGAVRSWDVAIHNYLLAQNKVVPHVMHEDGENRMPVGGFVKDPQIGMFDWVLSVDLTSLYPHLIMGFNVGPDTFRGTLPPMTVEEFLEGKAGQYADYLKEHNVGLAANCCLYTKERQGFLAALMEDLFAKRKIHKKAMLALEDKKEKEHTTEYDNEIAKLNNLQKAIKILLNSCYGALANPYFRWYDLALAESITISGRLVIRWAEKYINEYMNKELGTEGVDYVIAVDTDSLYLNVGEIVKRSGLTDKDQIHDFIVEFSETKLDPLFEKMYGALAEYLNCYKQAMLMKLEVIADRGIFVAKKKYVLNVLSSEGVRYEKPKMKIMGIEAVRSSTPQSCRDSIKESIKIMMTKDVVALREHIDDFREKFEGMSFEQVAFPRGINGLRKYADSTTIYKKGCPIHVRGALVYNNVLVKKKLDTKYFSIFDRDKIKFCYLTVPNPIHSNIISSPGPLPKELGLDKYVDYHEQFQKAFIGPIQNILDAIGWQLEEKNTLRRFFEE